MPLPDTDYCFDFETEEWGMVKDTPPLGARYDVVKTAFQTRIFRQNVIAG